MLNFACLALSVAVVVAAIAAVRASNLINAAIALVIGNSLLALLFFLLQSPYAASIQLSVGAGVVSALFIVAISLTESMRGGHHEE